MTWLMSQWWAVPVLCAALLVVAVVGAFTVWCRWNNTKHRKALRDANDANNGAQGPSAIALEMTGMSSKAALTEQRKRVSKADSYYGNLSVSVTDVEFIRPSTLGSGKRLGSMGAGHLSNHSFETFDDTEEVTKGRAISDTHSGTHSEVAHGEAPAVPMRPSIHRLSASGFDSAGAGPPEERGHRSRRRVTKSKGAAPLEKKHTSDIYL
jgi:hypothetical protein